MKELLLRKGKRFVENNGHMKIFKTSLEIISKVLMIVTIYLLLLGITIEVLTTGAINNLIVETTTVIDWCYSFTMIIFGINLVAITLLIMSTICFYFLDYQFRHVTKRIMKKQILTFINIALLTELLQYLYNVNLEYEIYDIYKLITIFAISGFIVNVINSRLILKNINDTMFSNKMIQTISDYSIAFPLGSKTMVDKVRKFKCGITFYYQLDPNANLIHLNRDRVLGTKDIVCSIPFISSRSKPAQLIIIIPTNYNKTEAYYHGVLSHLENDGFLIHNIKFAGENLQEKTKANKCVNLIKLRCESLENERDLYSIINIK